MSVSKLESLPNEILADILEKYINAVDIIKAFAFQLNQRFDVLIAQSQRLRFDFIRCHKDDFRFCMGLLPAYIDKIEQLALSERCTPGQMHAFFSFYPSFGVFKRLRKLYLQIDMDSAEVTVFENALCSLSTTTLHTLSLQISPMKTINSLDRIILDMFRMKTLKKLLISCDFFRMNWESLKTVSSNIEHLTIYGIAGCFDDLLHIFRCASSLRYLDMYLHLISYHNNYPSKSSSTESLPRMSMLRTAILYLRRSDESRLNQLEVYFKCMSSLHRLEIKTQDAFSSASVWETLIQTALPSLTSFTLEIIRSRLTEEDVSTLLAATDTAFWTKTQRFHLIIKELAPSNTNKFYPGALDDVPPHRSNEVIARWYIGPMRKLHDNSSVLNGISKLSLSPESHSLSQNYYLNNITHLVIDELNDTLLELITTHINCSQIKHLDVSSIKEENSKISLLLSYTTNIRSLRINLKQLYDEQLSSMGKHDNVQFLDISTDWHSLAGRDISVISSLFPHVEHMIIYPRDLQNIPMLQTSLPCLRSFTFRSTLLNKVYFYDDYQDKMLDHNLGQRAKFLFRRKGSWITVWMDQAAFQGILEVKGLY